MGGVHGILVGLSNRVNSNAEFHWGDLGNVVADFEGKVLGRVFDGGVLRLDMGGDGNGEGFIIGRGVVVHAMVDDCKSQPSGASGARLAQGLISWTTQTQFPTTDLTTISQNQSSSIHAISDQSNVTGSILFVDGNGDSMNAGNIAVQVLVNLTGLDSGREYDLVLLEYGSPLDLQTPLDVPILSICGPFPTPSSASTFGAIRISKLASNDMGNIVSLFSSSLISLRTRPDAIFVIGRAVAVVDSSVDCGVPSLAVPAITISSIGYRNISLDGDFNTKLTGFASTANGGGTPTDINTRKNGAIRS
ncbi:hypothetical protein HDU76_006635, partial [Blyttiomyces sp. JEL0837]